MGETEDEIVKKSILVIIIKNITDVKVLLAAFGFATLIFQYHISSKQDHLQLQQDTISTKQDTTTKKQWKNSGKLDTLNMNTAKALHYDSLILKKLNIKF